ncbi:MAG: hypothetical protein WA919_08960 [Coleofasciculaceae cyanobacterium]
MANHHFSKELLANKDERAIFRLVRAISLSQGQFSLILVSCNCPSRRQVLIHHLQEVSSIPIQELIVPSSSNTLFTTILRVVEVSMPQALMVYGLEAVVEIDHVISATNLVRDEFRKQFPFPLIIWINSEILQKLIRLAPDFKDWDLNPIRFEVPKNQFFELAAFSA